jgi:pyridoxal phosphate enzyme (YggS family)
VSGPSVGARASEVLGRIALAAARAGRRPESVRLVAVTKTVPVERILEAREAGLSVFGENYVQEAEGKIGAVPGAEWHFVGRLQGNKVKRAVSMFDWIETADSAARLADLSRRAVDAGRVLPVLLEVNLAGEPAKSGVLPGEVPALVGAAATLPGISLRGLMAIPPAVAGAEESRPRFAALRELLRRNAPAGGGMTELSMGMSDDFEVAVEEGATLVRIGTALFGERQAGEGRNK